MVTVYGIFNNVIDVNIGIHILFDYIQHGHCILTQNPTLHIEEFLWHHSPVCPNLVINIASQILCIVLCVASTLLHP